MQAAAADPWAAYGYGGAQPLFAQLPEPHYGAWQPGPHGWEPPGPPGSSWAGPLAREPGFSPYRYAPPHHNHPPWGPPTRPPPPPPPPPVWAPPSGTGADPAVAAAAAASALGGASGLAKEDLANLLMAWYHAGYYTGRFSRHVGTPEAASPAGA